MSSTIQTKTDIMSKTNDLLARREAAVTSGLGHVHPIFADRAKNAELWDVEGKRYIDFAAGIAVVNTGHLHPKVKAAVIAQLDKFSHTSINVVMYEPYIELAEKLNALAPGDSQKKTILINSGAEAIENCIKISRCYTNRTAVICFNGAFHGRTLLTMGMTGKVIPYKAGFGPFPTDIYHAPFPNDIYGVSSDDAITGLQQLFKSDIDPGRVAAFVIEPVQGEGGFYIAPTEFMHKLKAIADEHGILLVADEIQTGFGRTGKMFACEHSGIEPDLIAMAKGLAGGFPISAVTGKAEIMDAVPAASLGGTYSGNPVACAAALAVIDVMDEEQLPQRAATLGAHMKKRLNAMAETYSMIGDVRGLGMMVAIELFDNGDRKQPAAAKTATILASAREKGLILLSCGINANVIRFLAPLTIEENILDEGLYILEQCLKEVS